MSREFWEGIAKKLSPERRSGQNSVGLVAAAVGAIYGNPICFGLGIGVLTYNVTIAELLYCRALKRLAADD
jgi:hypothetical protein